MISSKALSTEPINTGRQFEFDIAKVFSLLFMVIIHVKCRWNFTEIASTETDVYLNLLEFMGGPLAAPVFIISMGVGSIYTKHKTPRDFAKRGVELLIQGYILNFFRDFIPFAIAKAADIDSSAFDHSWASRFLTVDILQFAGLTFLVFSLFAYLKLPSLSLFMVALLLQGIGVLLIGHFDSVPQVLQLILGLFFYTGKYSRFGLTLFLLYPTIGVLFAELLIYITNKTRFYLLVLLSSLVLFAAITIECYNIDFDL